MSCGLLRVLDAVGRRNTERPEFGLFAAIGLTGPAIELPRDVVSRDRNNGVAAADHGCRAGNCGGDYNGYANNQCMNGAHSAPL